ncbi:hypothetical protein R3P38DRAFT_2804602 [Favolaschia claudopus]|uniref:Uncharacterized protein n=1 Tax=Favolaschia claudopus TaxID=2862362 RepID=A0AAV9ZPV0_9AGAR
MLTLCRIKDPKLREQFSLRRFDVNLVIAKLANCKRGPVNNMDPPRRVVLAKLWILMIRSLASIPHRSQPNLSRDEALSDFLFARESVSHDATSLSLFAAYSGGAICKKLMGGIRWRPNSHFGKDVIAPAQPLHVFWEVITIKSLRSTAASSSDIRRVMGRPFFLTFEVLAFAFGALAGVVGTLINCSWPLRAVTVDTAEDANAPHTRIRVLCRICDYIVVNSLDSDWQASGLFFKPRTTNVKYSITYKFLPMQLLSEPGFPQSRHLLVQSVHPRFPLQVGIPHLRHVRVLRGLVSGFGVSMIVKVLLALYAKLMSLSLQ